MPRKPNLTASGYNAAFAKNLRTLIDETGISQQVLADSLPMKRTRQAISQYAAGITTPDYETLIEIARYFNVSVDWLIGYSSVRSSSPELRSICKYTGLSEKSIEFLNQINNGYNKHSMSAINALLEADSSCDFFNYFYRYLSIKYTHMKIGKFEYNGGLVLDSANVTDKDTLSLYSSIDDSYEEWSMCDFFEMLECAAMEQMRDTLSDIKDEFCARHPYRFSERISNGKH